MYTYMHEYIHKWHVPIVHVPVNMHTYTYDRLMHTYNRLMKGEKYVHAHINT